MKTKILALILCLAMCFSTVAALASCTPKDNGNGNGNGTGNAKPDSLVIMTEELDGLFNPFFSTTAADGTIVGMTQLGMISSDYVNGEVVESFGEGIASVALDFESVYNAQNDTTTYSFVIKNGIKFSDGMPLTMNDVMFNMYVYLDPVYSGSSTMYSIDIVGLQEYRNQQETSDSTGSDNIISQTATNRANDRIKELLNAYNQKIQESGVSGNYVPIAAMESYLKNDWTVSQGYKQAVVVSSKFDTVTGENVLADYKKYQAEFKKELELDYEKLASNYTEDPYKSYAGLDFTDPLTAFMFSYGYIPLEYEKDANGKPDYNKIKDHSINYTETLVTNKEQAIKFVFEDYMQSKFEAVLFYSQASQTLSAEFVSQAKSVMLEENRGEDGSLRIPNISGIVSLGHTTDTQTVTVNGKEYTVAHEHNADGTVVNANEYDVLQITVNGVDPKAVWSFAFSVAPQHYYGKGQTVDIKNNKFGVVFASFDFMSGTLQRDEVTNVPMGAGAYKASNKANEDNPKGSDFYKNNVVYFKANNDFLLGAPKTQKICYQVVSSSNALDALAAGTVHFVSPQLTDNNMAKLEELKANGIKSVYTDQLGYGYIGINAGKVPDMNIRKAIMTAMDTSRAISYYRAGTASRIFWPMSKVSWAYPTGSSATDNQHTYPAKQFNEEQAKADIRAFMEAANVKAGDSKLKFTFTIAGSNLTEHPAYAVFLYAAEILNDLGWNVEVVADIQALTKLSTGSLSVWAAAWGSSIDPDLYQVYHKDSTATSTLAWGYRQILENPSLYSEENSIINELSVLIDEARETDIKDVRKQKYEEAMKKILDLAVELPVYQRSVLYAYDSTVINEETFPETINPFSSPLDKIWEIELVG